MPEPSFGLVESFALGFPHVGWGGVSSTLPGLRVSSYLIVQFRVSLAFPIRLFDRFWLEQLGRRGGFPQRRS